MNALPVSLLAVLLLMLGGCGEKAAGNKTEATTPAIPAVTANKLTPEEKFAETKIKAEAGDAEAQSNLGSAYYNGEGVSTDYFKAFEWYQKAAIQGQVSAQYKLGLMYSLGRGVDKDETKSVAWYEKAANHGSADAQFKLGSNIRYILGGDVSKEDAAKSEAWLLKAATQGHAGAQHYLGLLRSTTDAAKAVEWYQKAAMQGHALAQTALGGHYSSGNGVPKDNAKAFEWYQKAAAQGRIDAQTNLGFMYFKGQGTSPNLVLAYAWLNLASAQKTRLDTGNDKVNTFFEKEDEDRAVARDRLERLLSAKQIIEAQRLASNWKKGDILQASSDSATSPTSPDGKPSKQGTGTAFAVSSAGHALTNHHVINGCTEVKVAGREGIAKVITSDSVNDLALLQLPGKTKDIASLNPDPGKLRQGEDIIVFGYPLEWALSSGGNITPGTLSALTGLGNNTNQIQITAPIQPGSSGSPVMDKKGDVVGMVSMKLSDSKMAKATGQIGQNVNFAVNGQTVKTFLDANKVPYKTGGGYFSREKSNADIAEEASKWTVLVECWK